MTSAERKRKYLEKLKANGVNEAFKKEKAASEKVRRDRIKSGLEKLPKAVRQKNKTIESELQAEEGSGVSSTKKKQSKRINSRRQHCHQM